MKKFKSESIHEALVEEVTLDNKIQYFAMALIAIIGMFFTTMALRDIGREEESFNAWKRAREARRPPRKEDKDAIPFVDPQLAY